jgi:hypothetical protein
MNRDAHRGGELICVLAGIAIHQYQRVNVSASLSISLQENPL